MPYSLWLNLIKFRGKKPSVADERGVLRAMEECANPVHVLRLYNYSDLTDAVTKLALKVSVVDC